MDLDVAQEAKRAKRYIVVRVVSSGGDIVLFSALLYTLGIEWLVIAYGISGFVGHVVRYLGTKLWVFDNHNKTPGELLREYLLYLGLRIVLMLPVVGTFYLLFNVFGVSWYISTGVTVAVFWPISFAVNRWLFVGSVRDLWEPLRKFNKARSS